MMFFGKSKKHDAAARKQDEELELAISARIAEVVRVAETPPGAAPQPFEAYPEPPAMDPYEPASVTYAPPEPYADVLGAISNLEATASQRAGEPVSVGDADAGRFFEVLPPPVTAAAELGYGDAYSAEAAASWPRMEVPHPATFTPAAVSRSEPVIEYEAPQRIEPPRSSMILRAEPDASSLTRSDSLSPFALNPDAVAVDQLLQETSKHLRNMGSVNILVAGQTGVGKSTLINSVFGEQFAQTAAGRPVTQHAEWYTSESVPLRILDTRGLEAKDYAITLHDMRTEIETLRAMRDSRDQLHMAWVCISSPSSRVQDCEVDIVRVLNKYDIPAIIVLTKDDDDPDFAEIVAQIMDERRAVYASIVPVRALKKPKRPSAGLEQLVVATFTALPAAHRAAFAAAQKINRDMNKVAAEDYVTAAASAAAAAAVIPLPFADMVTLAPIQASMLVGISSAFGLTFERQQVMQIITTVLGCLALSTAGSWAVGTALKFIPGPGSVIGAVLNAGVAGTLTRTLGRTYIRFIYSFIENHGRVPTADETIEIFPAFFRARRTEHA